MNLLTWAALTVAACFTTFSLGGLLFFLLRGR